MPERFESVGSSAGVSEAAMAAGAGAGDGEGDLGLGADLGFDWRGTFTGASTWSSCVSFSGESCLSSSVVVYNDGRLG